MSSLSIPSFSPTEESCSGSPNLSDGSQGGSLENPEGRSFTPKGAKCKPEVTKHNKIFNCSALDCKRNQGFTSLAILRRHETETHGMHSARQKLHCPILTCERHTGKGFQRGEQLKGHIRRRHPQSGDNLGRRQKRKAEADWDESFEDIKRLRDDTRDLSYQFATQAVQLAEMVLLIRQLQENTGQLSATTDEGTEQKG
jgi:hypothetical protein